MSKPDSPAGPRLSRPRLSRFDPLVKRLFAPVDIASIVVFRVAFGAIMMWEVWRYFDHGWIERYWIEPTFFFTYYGFSWVRPWPGDGMYFHFLILGGLAACILFGRWYRIVTPLFFVGFTYVFLLDQANYLNHFYLVSLISFLMIFVPAHRAFSMDAARRPEIRTDTVPAWSLWLLRAQLGLVYFYGGVAKLNGDWLRAEPLRDWLGNSTDFPVIGVFFTREWMVYLMAYGGLLLDLVAVPALLWKPTRKYAFLAVTLFHLMNAELFSIGIFPWFMIAATTLFLPPDWPRRLAARWPGVASKSAHATASGPPTRAATGGHRATALLVALYLMVQILVPLRHFLYPGSVHWTEEGHRFSWHMKLRDKESRARFFAVDPDSGRQWTIDLREHLARRQRSKMASRPDMILQFAHYCARELRAQGYERIEIRAHVLASLNDHARQLLIDPAVDLAVQPRTLLHASWIVPFGQGIGPEPVGTTTSTGR